MRKNEVRSIPTAPFEAKGWGILKWIGPAFIVSAMDVGGGEMIMASTVGARYGPWLAWTIVLCAFMIYWATQECARYAALTGETPVKGFSRVSTWLAIVVLIAEWLWTSFFSIGIIANAGTAIYWLTGIGTWQIWSILLYLLLVVVLISPPWIYSVVEKICTVSGLTQIGGMILCAIVVTNLGALAEFFKGMFSFGYLPPGADLMLWLGLIGSGFGSGAGTALAAAYYIRERGIGMAKYAGRVTGLLGKAEEVPLEGYRPSTDEESRKNFKDWFKIVRTNIAGVLWPINLFGGLVFMYVATIVLRPAGLVPSGMKTVSVVAENFKVILGSFGWFLFMIVGLLNLWDTMLGCIDRDCRIEGNAIRTLFKPAAKYSERFWYMFILIQVFLTGSVVFFLGTPFYLFLIQAVFSAVQAPIVIFAILMLRRLIPKEYQAGKTTYTLVAVSIIFYVLMALLTIASQFGIKIV